MADISPDPAPATPPFWRRTPPAVFPALMGLWGLGLAWRAAADAFPGWLTSLIGEAMLALFGLLYLFALSCYVSKLSVRPMVLLEDIMSPPGRAGAATVTLGLFLFSAALFPYAPLLAFVIFWLGLLGHLTMAICAVLVMSQQDRGLKVTPAWHLSFVGFIVGAVAAVPLGMTSIATALFVLTALLALIIYGVSALQLKQEETPAPARPLLAIHLAPVSLFATVASLLGGVLISFACVVIAVGLGAVLASRWPWLSEAGFSPLWGAFTFPVAALAIALFTTSSAAPGLAYLGLVPLAIATIIIPVIAARILAMWANGQLAGATGASMA